MTRSCPLPLLAALLFIPLAAAAKSPTNLQSPWDLHPVTPSNGFFYCGAYTPVGPNITVTTPLNSTNFSPEVKEAVIAQSVTGVRQLTHRIIHAADNYRLTGSRLAAQCVYTLLATAARAQALTGSMANDNAWTAYRTAVRVMAISLLKVRASNVATPQQTALINQWLINLVTIERKYYEHDKCGKNTCPLFDHRGIAVAAASTAVGIAADNSGLYNWGLRQYRTALHNISAQGMLHYDTHHTYAMKSNIESAAYLTSIAQLALANDENLYDYRNGALHSLVRTVALGIVSPALYAKAAGEDQTMTMPLSWQITWAADYNHRFPDPVVDSLLNQLAPPSTNTGA